MVILSAMVAFAETPAATVEAFVRAFNARDAVALAKEVDGPVEAQMVGSMASGTLALTLKATVTKTTVADDDAYLEVKTEFSGAVSDHASETLHLRRTGEGWKIVPTRIRQVPSIGLMADMFSGQGVFAQAKRAAKKTACLSNVKQIAVSMFMYAADHDDILPKDASRWKAAVMSYVKNESFFHCPEDTSGAVSYFFEPRLAGKSMVAIAEPAATAMIVEGAAGKANFRHDGACSLGFLDGHAKIVRREEALKARTVSLK